MLKKCNSCDCWKSIGYFYSKMATCINCFNIKRKEYRDKNKEIIKEQKRRHYKKHRKSIIKKNSNYYYKNKDAIIEQSRLRNIRRRSTDLDYIIKIRLRDRIRKALIGKYKSGSAVSDLGCSIADLKLYLEAQFQPGMTWDNYGKWHIDHIKPLASYTLTNRKQFLEACNYTNLQPLWAKENLRKGCRY